MPNLINEKYILGDYIGSGGMANVYKATEVSTGETVAVKILKDEFSNDKELLRRFHREAKASLKLCHDNIVRAFDVGEFDEIPYIVFEYVEGHTLKELIEEKGKLSVEESIVLCCQILDALDAAHSAGIIHRDIKPQNIIVNSLGVAKLTDFGIAREVSASTITFDGKNVVGSVHYISPEQARGDVVTTVSDIYSVGITLYEMLTGDVPFHGETAVATAIMQINETPAPPQCLEPEIPDALNQIVLKAIEKEPVDRYQDAIGMKTDLIRSLTEPGSKSVEDNTTSVHQFVFRPVPIHRIFLGIIISVFVPIAVLAMVFMVYRNRNQIQNPLAASISTIAPEDILVSENNLSFNETEVTNDYPSYMRLEDALISLKKNNIGPIYVRYQHDSPESIIGYVIDSENTDSGAYLTVATGPQGRYRADVSFTLDVPENDSDLMFVYKTAGETGTEYYVILKEIKAVKEDNFTVSTSVTSKDEAARMVYLLVNGVEVRSQSVKFAG